MTAVQENIGAAFNLFAQEYWTGVNADQPELLKIQGGNGAWKGRNETWGTCFAILFLKKATRPLVASEDVK